MQILMERILLLKKWKISILIHPPVNDKYEVVVKPNVINYANIDDAFAKPADIKNINIILVILYKIYKYYMIW